MVSFTHLHVHSYYSFLDGTNSPEQLVTQARKLKFKHLALTDHNALHGAINFYKIAKQTGIHPIIGAEVTLTDKSSLILLVKNLNGYRNLCQLLSLGHLQGGHLKFQLELKDVFKRKGGLIILSGGQKGKIWQLVRQRKISDAQSYCRQMKAAFNKDFYIELQHFTSNDFLINVRLRDLAIQHDIAMVATNNVHLMAREEWPLRKILHAIDQNTLLEKIDTAGNHEQYLKSSTEMVKLFSKFPGAITNSEKIAKYCDFEFQLGKPVFPKIDLPAEETSFSYLWKIAFLGAQQRYQPLTKAVIDRLSYELNVIDELGFADYFIIVKDIVDFCHREGIPCVGRGSAGDSVVSYVLNITQIDPMRYNLYFERFLNPDRTDPPDIDLDICWKNRDRVLEYVYLKYGETRTAMICTFNTFQLRSSIRDVARVYGFPEDEISAITKYLPHYGIKQLTQAIDHLPECRDLQQNADVFEEVLNHARRIADFPRHQSIHPGGVIIAPDQITNYTPLQIAGKGIVVSHYDMYSIEPLGLVKMDLLGVRSLSIITDCLKSVTNIYQKFRGVERDIPNLDSTDENDSEENIQSDLFEATHGPLSEHPSPEKMPKDLYRFDTKKGKIVPENMKQYLTPQRFPFLDVEKKHLSPLDLRMIPENDPQVTALLRVGLSMGCFQTESPGMRGLLNKMQIDSVDDVIIAVALIRPGAANSGMKDQYILRRAGLVEIEFIHPALKEVLQDTYGNIIYQEQVMQIASELAGFTLSQSDVLRKAMTKSRDRKTLLSMQKDFLEGTQKKGLTLEQAQQIWMFLANFVGYGFNKAHSATYGIIAYQTAYLKHYFPVQYMTAVLNNHGGFYSKAAYIEECRRMGIILQPPDVNFSMREFSCADDKIWVGLDMVYELTENTKAEILRERKKQPFTDYYDFVQRVQPREGEVNNLIKCGALRSLHPNEPYLLLQHRLFFRNKHNRNLTNSLLHGVDLIPYNLYQRLLYEMEILNFTVTDHPLSLFDDKIDWSNITPSHQIETNKGKEIKFAGWLVTSRRVKSQKEEYMKFLTLEDRYGLCEAIMFPKVYNKYGHLVKGYGPYLITGSVQSRLPGEANLLVEKLEVVKYEKSELEKKFQQQDSINQIPQILLKKEGLRIP
jgi:DNA polymerase III alpha subunit